MTAETLRLVFVNDDPDWRRLLVEDAVNPEVGWPHWDVKAFEGMSQAIEGGADILVVDMSSLTSAMFPDPHRACGPILSFLNLHPGAVVIVSSAMAACHVQDLIDEVCKATGQEIRHYDVSGDDGTYLRTMINLAAEGRVSQ